MGSQILECPVAHDARLFHPFGADFSNQRLPMLPRVVDAFQGLSPWFGECSSVVLLR